MGSDNERRGQPPSSLIHFPLSSECCPRSPHPWQDEYDARLVALCHEADGIARLEIELTPLARHRAGAAAECEPCASNARSTGNVDARVGREVRDA